MSRHLAVPAWTVLAWAVVVAGPSRALAERADTASAVSATTGSERSLRLKPEPAVDWSDHRLRRAAAEQSAGNLQGVIASLEGIDFSTPPAFPEADRAAFLLAQAYLELGSVERFATLAGSVARWERPSPYTRWLVYQLHWVEAAGARAQQATADSSSAADTVAHRATVRPTGSGAADALAAGLLLRDGDGEAALRMIADAEPQGASAALISYLTALALASMGGDDEPALVRLSTADTVTALGRDLAGAALVRRATRALARNQDPRPLLASVPAGSRFASRARHMHGLVALERGDVEQGRQILESLLADDSSYAARREVLLALAGRSLDDGRWEAAHQRYRELDGDVSRNREALQHLLAEGAFDTLWTQWERGSILSDALILDAGPAQRLAQDLARASADLTSQPTMDAPGPDVPPASRQPWPIPPPPAEAVDTVAMAARQIGETGYELERSRWAMAREHHRLEELRRYLALGLARARGEAERLRLQTSLLDSLGGSIDAIHARLAAVRDEAKRRLALRSEEVLESGAKNLRWLAAMRHFHVEGPDRERPLPSPPGFPTGDVLTVHERSLTTAMKDFVERLALEGPALVDRSFEQAWGPGIIDRAVAQSVEAHRQLEWARSLAGALDSSIAAASTSDTLRGLAARVAELERTSGSLRLAHRALRDRVARAAVERSLAGLEAEREAIDYGLAASAYGLSVGLDRPGTEGGAPESTTVATRSAPRDSAAGADADQELDDPEAAVWRARATDALRTFLDRHPRSAARGEMRFRLADLMLVEARRSFREQMARYVKDQAEGGASGALPVLSQRPALALYRTILAEDGDFPQRDAVLFNAGMILADEADPEAARLFQELVASHPDSRYAQEAYLRMGDMAFDEKRFAECVPLYQRAAAGADVGLRVIALYKMGWAHFNQERLPEAADAFRAVLDVYESEAKVGINVNIAPEAEAYLIHCLARAGGAKAFADYFDRIGARPYERRVLLALGQHFRRFGLYAEAVAADELAIARFPRHAEALISARRLTETYQRWDQPAQARKAQLEVAFRFAPGGDWYEAQTSDSVRQAGSDFARGSWTSVALHHHREARRAGSPQEWRAALDLYRALLSTWPNDGEAPAHRLHAGEASFHLGQHAEALDHYRAAASTGRDSIAEQALLQQVAVTDAWYESTRVPARAASSRPGTTAAEPLGRDSLARAVLAAGDELVARYPDHRAAPDVAWRQGQLAFAHGWFDRAARDFEGMMVRHPNDPRAATAAALRGDALFRAKDYEAAGAAFEVALQVARRTGRDSLERPVAQAIPVCYYRHAEVVAAADSSSPARYAPLFEKVATGWPDYEHAHAAQYRAALAYLQAGTPREGIRSLQTLIRTFPKSEYVKDAHLQIPKTWESMGEKEKAAEAYVAFADRYPKDESAGEAWLKAADLHAAAGRTDRADTLRLAYIAKYPDDVETAMEILEALARRDLASVSPERPISSLLDRPERARPVTKAPRAGKSRKAAAPAAPSNERAQAAPPPSHLAAYLRRAQAHPKLASQSVLAQVRFLQGEEVQKPYAAARLRQPLETSVVAKQTLLDSLVSRYRASVDLGVPEWAHASAFRIGEALVAFGEALEQSERPADLTGDDLRAYEDVLLEQSAAFYDRGEGVWTELLRQKGDDTTDDTWVTRAKSSLWKRLAQRFLFRPEVEFPLVAADAPRTKRDREGVAGAAGAPTTSGRNRAPGYAQREGDQR